MIGQDIWQRVFTGRDEKVMRTGTIVAGVYCIAYGIVGALIGAAAKVIVPKLDNPDGAFAAVVDAVLPTGLIGLVLAAALAAIMSTASATLLAASTILANDLLPLVREVPDQMRATRIATFVLGAAVVGVSLVLNDVVGALTVAYDLLTGALFVPIVLGLLWPRGHRDGRVRLDGGLLGGDRGADDHQRAVLQRPDHVRAADQPGGVRRGQPRDVAGARAGEGGDVMSAPRYGPPDASVQPRFTGPRTFMRLPHVTSTEDVDVALIGVPIDDAVSFRSGARFGPEAVRSASALLRPYNPLLKVDPMERLSLVDGGDTPTVPGYHEETLTRIDRHLPPLHEAGVIPCASAATTRWRWPSCARPRACTARSRSCTSTRTPTCGSSTTARATSTAPSSSGRSRRGSSTRTAPSRPGCAARCTAPTTRRRRPRWATTRSPGRSWRR